MMPLSNCFLPMGPVSPRAGALLLMSSSMLILNPAAEASTYACFDRSTGEQVAISEIDISTPTVSCRSKQTDSGSTPTAPSTSSPQQAATDPLAGRRAINLARNTAVALNGGLGQYRPGSCMFASAMNNPCITRSDSAGIVFTIPGGPPGWEQSGEQPTITTVVVIAPDGRSVVESRQN